MSPFSLPLARLALANTLMPAWPLPTPTLTPMAPPLLLLLPVVSLRLCADGRVMSRAASSVTFCA
ncbi:hypothetical protein QF022_002405 [Vogesella perlucida]|nr:hypothetical protein [Vogesella perlucida]